MTRDEKKKLIENLHAVWNTGDVASIPDIYATDFVVHWPRSVEVPDSYGHAGAKTAIMKTRAAFPDWREDVVDMIIEGDRVVTRYISTGTHRGPLEGIQPTGKTIKIDEMSIYRIEAGKVTEQWCLVDDITLLRQLGQM